MRKLAIVSAVVLVGGYVFLKSGGSAAIMPSTKSGRVVNESDRDEALLPGSKSSAPFAANDKLDTSAPAERGLMSSSKSGPIARPDMFEPTTQPTTAPDR